MHTGSRDLFLFEKQTSCHDLQSTDSQLTWCLMSQIQSSIKPDPHLYRA